MVCELLYICPLQISYFMAPAYLIIPLITSIAIANCVCLGCPDVPINVQIFTVNSHSLTVIWTKPHHNNAPITGYNINYHNPNNVTKNLTAFSTEEQVTITNLHPGEYYTFTIIAINDICPSQPSEPATVHTMEEGM